MMIILNEKEYAEECLKNKIIDKKPFKTLSILAKYYYYCLGYRKKRITELLIDFIKSTYPLYDCNKASWNDNIEKIAANAGKYELHEIEGIWITKSELNVIDKIENKVLRRLAFTYLCLAKLSDAKNQKNSGWVNNDTKEIFNMARISCNVADRNMKICDLHSLGLIEFPKRIDNLSCRVKFIDNESENLLFISDFRELGYEYLKYTGENFIRCQECRILVRNNKSKNKKYCKNCAGYIPKETKSVVCVDCGTEFEVDSLNNKTIRCGFCQQIHRNNYQKEFMKKKRN